MTIFPWLILLLLMTLIAELVIVGPRAVRSIMHGEAVRIEPVPARLLLLLVGGQILLVLGWALLFKQQPG
jgi:hypothetical protein